MGVHVAASVPEQEEVLLHRMPWRGSLKLSAESELTQIGHVASPVDQRAEVLHKLTNTSE